MPSSWSESNRLHSSNMREDAANAELEEFRNTQLEELIIEDIIEENYDNAFSRLDVPRKYRHWDYIVMDSDDAN